MPVDYGDDLYWVYDVSLSVLFAEMAAEPSEWEPELRRNAVVGANSAVPLDEWTDGRETAFIALIHAACARLATKEVITAAEAAEWRVLDDATVIWRGGNAVSTKRIVTLGEALIRIIEGEYPPAPAGHLWYLGNDDPAATIRLKS
ncbi:hypothetical protein BCF44_10223 [Kutzneria buriramensis]|uniref:Uncharacterized protein n=1 Tax=Kutzneria buriramensis TaxID=1045776 RepID=A0A3E0I4Y8_9PSEU|nr:hypothetical protein BCF44_10223 [Kutzneria buriramensis]